MESDWARSFNVPDEVIEDPLVREEVVEVANMTVGRFIVQPGWRWSTHVKPRKGTEWCEARHLGVCTGGTWGVLLADGTEYTIGTGQAFVIPAGHDIWVEGDVPAESIEWAGSLAWHPGPEGLASRLLVTLLLSDIVDSTPTATRLGDDRWQALLRSHDATVADVVNRFHGRLVKHTGDGALAAFPSARNAVLAGRALVEAVEPLEIAVRVGVHTGEVTSTAADVHGLPVHQLARITALAGSSEVLVSQMTVLLAGDADTSFEHRGAHELRGLPGSVELFAARSG